MRHYTLNYIKKLLDENPKLAPGRRPEPMPGKHWPTRVAWHICIGPPQRGPATEQNPHGFKFTEMHSLCYIGKPNRYRALQARNFIASAKHGMHLVFMWQAEFDKAGLVAYCTESFLRGANAVASGAFAAYHPHSPKPEIVEAFVKPLHIKYVGGMRLYSLKKKLAQEAIDAYYTWYYEHFKKKLRRPKSVPMQAAAPGPAQAVLEQAAQGNQGAPADE